MGKNDLTRLVCALVIAFALIVVGFCELYAISQEPQPVTTYYFAPHDRELPADFPDRERYGWHE